MINVVVVHSHIVSINDFCTLKECCILVVYFNLLTLEAFLQSIFKISSNNSCRMINITLSGVRWRTMLQEEKNENSYS